jgi:hypothetical protein
MMHMAPKVPIRTAIWFIVSLLVLIASLFLRRIDLRFGVGALAGVSLLIAAPAAIAAYRNSKLDSEAWDTIRGLIDLLKNAVEIVAISVGGIWAYDKFIASEEPGLRVHAKREAALTSWRDPRGICHARLSVSLENIGITPFKLDSVDIEVYPFSAEPVSGSQVRKIDHNTFKREGITVLHDFDRHFQYGDNISEHERWYQDVEWTMTPDLKDEYMFRALFFVDGHTFAEWAPSDWGYICAKPVDAAASSLRRFPKTEQ